MTSYFWDQAKLDRNTNKPAIPDKNGITEKASHCPAPSKGKNIGKKKNKREITRTINGLGWHTDSLQSTQ